jgi:hypothetical protein
MKGLVKHMVVSTLAISLCIGVMLHQHRNSTADLCKTAPKAVAAKSIAIATLCKPSQQSWFSWLQGNSRSTQFHFVDLLELLNRFNPRG